MELKDKLDLLWKYSLLALVSWVFLSHHCGYRSGCKGWCSSKTSRTVEVETEIINGDTSLTILINGEKVDFKELDELEKLEIGYKKVLIMKKEITSE